MAKQSAEVKKVEEEVKNTEVSENTEEVKEGFLTKAKNKVKGINFKAAAKVVAVGAVSGALGYVLGKKAGSDSVDYDLGEFTTDSTDDSNVIDITEF